MQYTKNSFSRSIAMSVAKRTNNKVQNFKKANSYKKFKCLHL